MLFGVLLLLTYWAHVSFLKVNVVFYAAMLDGALATLLMLFVVSSIKWLKVFTVFEKLQLGLFWLLLGYAYAISIPTVIDRSLSFYTLEKLQQRGGGILLDRMPEVFTQEYMKEHHLVDIRMTEQMEVGTVVVRDGCVQLTPWGNSMATASRFYRLHFLPTRRLLMDTYSAALVDPFQGDQGGKDYVCH